MANNYGQRSQRLPQSVAHYWRNEKLFSAPIVRASGGQSDRNGLNASERRLCAFYKCSQLGDTLGDSSHTSSHTSLASHRCFATRSTDREFARHLKDSHLNDSLYCVYCYPQLRLSSTQPSAHHLDRHAMSYKNTNEVKRLNHDSLVKHMKESHRFRRFQCSLCLYRAVSADHVNIHQSLIHVRLYNETMRGVSEGSRRCRIFECEPIDADLQPSSHYYNSFGARRLEELSHYYQCCYCTFTGKASLNHLLDHIVHMHPDYPLLYYCPQSGDQNSAPNSESITIIESDDNSNHSENGSSKCCTQKQSHVSHKPLKAQVRTQDNRVTSSQDLKAKIRRQRLLELTRSDAVGEQKTKNKSLENIRRAAPAQESSLSNRYVMNDTLNRLKNKVQAKTLINKFNRKKRYENRFKKPRKVINIESSSEESSDDNNDKRNDTDSDNNDGSSGKCDVERNERLLESSDEDSDGVVRQFDSDSDRNDDNDDESHKCGPAFVCVFCEQTFEWRSDAVTHMESHFEHIYTLTDSYYERKRVYKWIQMFIDEQNSLAVYDSEGCDPSNDTIRYECPLCVKLAPLRRRKARAFRYFWEVKAHVWLHSCWRPVRCRVCAPEHCLPNCDHLINKHLNTTHHSLLSGSSDGVINALIGDKMKNSFTSEQRLVVEKHYMEYYSDPIVDTYIQELIDSIVADRDRKLRLKHKMPEDLPRVVINRLPHHIIDYYL